MSDEIEEVVVAPEAGDVVVAVAGVSEDAPVESEDTPSEEGEAVVAE